MKNSSRAQTGAPDNLDCRIWRSLACMSAKRPRGQPLRASCASQPPIFSGFAEPAAPPRAQGGGARSQTASCGGMRRTTARSNVPRTVRVSDRAPAAPGRAPPIVIAFSLYEPRERERRRGSRRPRRRPRAFATHADHSTLADLGHGVPQLRDCNSISPGGVSHRRPRPLRCVGRHRACARRAPRRPARTPRPPSSAARPDRTPFFGPPRVRAVVGVVR